MLVIIRYLLIKLNLNLIMIVGSFPDLIYLKFKFHITIIHSLCNQVAQLQVILLNNRIYLSEIEIFKV